MKLNKKHVLIGISVVVLVLLAFLKLRNTTATATGTPADASRTAAVVMVRRGTIDNTITLSGEFHPFQVVDIHSKVAGFLKSIFADVGDRVRSGQVIAILEIPELKAELQSADASVRHATDAIERARSELEGVKSAHEAFHSAYSRLKQASEARAGLIAEQEIDDSQAKDKEAEAQVSNAQAALSEALSQLAIAEANQKQMSALSDYSNITVPFNGVITKRYADTGALIQAGTSSNTQTMPIVRLAETDKLRLVLPVPESAVPRVQLGTTVKVRVPAMNRIFSGIVARYADALDPETRTMHTEIDVKNPDNALVDGMYAEADIVLDKKDSVLTLPMQAVTRNGADAMVLVVNAKNQLEQRQIKLGLEGTEQVEVLSGLKERDLVLISGSGQFRPGDKIVPKLSETAGQTGEAQQ
jgi:RND family efflux transporter MFP subunit